MISKNISKLLTLGGAIGVFITGYLGIKAYEESKQILDELEIDLKEIETKEEAMQVVKATGKCWIKVGAAALLTEGCIVGSHFNHLKTQACMAGVATAIGTQLKKLDKGLLEELGGEKYQELKYKINLKDAEKKVEKNLPKIRSIEQKNKYEDGDVYYDSVTEQYFWATEKDILKAEIELNKTFQRNNEVSIEEYISFFNNKSLEINPIDGDWGWYMDSEFDRKVTTDTYDDIGEEMNGYYISLHTKSGLVNGDHQAIIITPSIAPSDPSETFREYQEYMQATRYDIEPGDQIELNSVA